jgi:mannose-6-phosphate isomerase-like protein (cupin superfamily)
VRLRWRSQDAAMVPGSVQARASRRLQEEVAGRIADRNVDVVRRKLEDANGGYEIVHTSPGLEIGVYVLVAPEPDHQEAHVDDEVYVVLAGEGALTIDGVERRVAEGDVMFVPAGVDHRFTGYVGLSVLVVFSRPR